MLNSIAFKVLAGNPKKWDDEMVARTKAGFALTFVQEEQYQQGRRSAVLDHSVHGWLVRSNTNLDGRKVLFGGAEYAAKHGRTATKEEAIAWGTKWANRDPDKREFIARKKDLP